MSIARVTEARPTASSRPLADHKFLRLSATLLGAGFVFFAGVGQLHPGVQDSNSHPAVFSEYAASASWTAVHLGQFIGLAVIIAGLLVLLNALRVDAGTAGLVARLGMVSATVSLALSAVLQAVDGVTLKRTVDVWVNAPGTEKAARFASAEAIRWVEEGVRSYQTYMLGLTFVLLAVLVIWTARIPRAIGYLMGFAGLAYLVQGWVLGSEGFSANFKLTQYIGYAFFLAGVVWLLVIAWWTSGSGTSRPEAQERLP